MKKRSITVLLSLLLPLAACNPNPRPTPEPAPRPPHSHPNAARCTHPSPFVLHGLWPQNNNGTYPENCSTEPGPRNPAAYSDIYPDPGLLNHEWRTHGTCSSL